MVIVDFYFNINICVSTYLNGFVGCSVFLHVTLVNAFPKRETAAWPSAKIVNRGSCLCDVVSLQTYGAGLVLCWYLVFVSVVLSIFGYLSPYLCLSIIKLSFLGFVCMKFSEPVQVIFLSFDDFRNIFYVSLSISCV